MPVLDLPLVDPETAPAPVGDRLKELGKRYGFLPNLYREFAHAPIALEAYLAVSDQFQKGTLTTTERNVVLLTVSRTNGCRYCVAVHSTLADLQKDDPAVTAAIRDGRPIPDPRLEALRRLTEALVVERGYADAEVAAFVAAGFRKEQVLEVLVGVAMKTLSNYTNHLFETPLDPAFAARAWTR